MSYVFYDTETTGLDPRFDQIIQFAAIKTDENFNETDRINVRCRVQPHIIPSATALAINQTPISHCFEPALPSHYEMMTTLRAKLEGWSPAVFCGWNSISFDEEFLRYGFYQSLQPSYLTSFFGNARLDILKIAQAAYVFEPRSLSVPANHKGNDTFSLDPLSRANGHIPQKAHDALSDVQATIYLARILRQNAPQVWSQAVRFSRKVAVTEFLAAGEVCILTESYMGKSYQYPVAQIGIDPEYAPFLVTADLRRDFSEFSAKTTDNKLQWLSASPQPIRKVKANASPMLMPIDQLDHFQGADIDALYDTAETLMADRTLCTELTAGFLEMTRREFSNEFVEQQLYDEFATPDTKRYWTEFHKAPWANRWTILQHMPDIRYRKLGMRLVYEHAPGSIPADQLQMMRNFISAKATGRGFDDPPWRTIGKAQSDLAEARTDERFLGQADILDEYAAYLGRIG